MLGLVRAPFGHPSVLSARSMPPPVDRIRDLPSSGDLSFPQPVHESVSGTSLTTTGQDLSPRSSQDPPQQQGHRSDVSNKEHESGAPDSSTAQDSASYCSTSREAHGLEAPHSTSPSPAALPEVAAKPRDLIHKCDRQTRSQTSLSSSAGGAFSSSRGAPASRHMQSHPRASSLRVWRQSEPQSRNHPACSVDI